MPTRVIVLSALIASCVSSVVAFTLGLLVAVALFHVPLAEAQVSGTATATPAAATASPQASTTPTPAPVIRARRFELVDTTGTTRATLAAEAELVGLSILDEAGQVRLFEGISAQGDATLAVLHDSGGVILAARPDSAGVGVRAPDGSTAVGMGIAGDGTALIAVGEPRSAGAVLGASPAGLIGLRVQDETGRPRAGMLLDPDGSASIRLMDNAGQLTWQAP